MCDANGHFLRFDISCTPTTHDSLAWIAAYLGHKISFGQQTHLFFILGAIAFTTTKEMVTPGEDDAVNFEQSSL